MDQRRSLEILYILYPIQDIHKINIMYKTQCREGKNIKKRKYLSGLKEKKHHQIKQTLLPQNVWAVSLMPITLFSLRDIGMISRHKTCEERVCCCLLFLYPPLTSYLVREEAAISPPQVFYYCKSCKAIFCQWLHGSLHFG